VYGGETKGREGTEEFGEFVVGGVWLEKRCENVLERSEQSWLYANVVSIQSLRGAKTMLPSGELFFPERSEEYLSASEASIHFFPSIASTTLRADDDEYSFLWNEQWYCRAGP
jgi:hypothetical protein